MKKNIQSIAMLGLMLGAMGGEGFANEKPEKPMKPIFNEAPFKKKHGVLKMIEDYILIMEGKSKKGILKQNRIKDRIQDWINKGFLTEEDLK